MSNRIDPKLGKPVSSRVLNYGDMVKKLWGDEYYKPDVVYEMSNGRKYYSTDRTESGIYRRP